MGHGNEFSKGSGGQAMHYYEGAWHEGNPLIAGPMTHGLWMASMVFDGARYFEGMTPDLDLHCARTIESAHGMGLEPKISGPEIEALVHQGLKHFDPARALYIRPAFFAADGFVSPDPASTRFVLSLFEKPMPDFEKGFSACLSERIKPGPLAAPTHITASCLSPTAAIALREAGKRGFDNAIVCDPLGNIAEFASANLFMVKSSRVMTPAANGTFLNGITRQRVIGLLRQDGVQVEECRIEPAMLAEADEIFATGNYPKVSPAIRYNDRSLPIGPVARRAKALYWQFASQQARDAA